MNTTSINTPDTPGISIAKQPINPEINNLNARLKTIEDVLYLLNEEQTSYEKMGLDKNIYKLEKFYKENFDNINEQIAQSIEKFEKVGIKLNKEDFDYDNYVSEYMNTFFEEYKKQRPYISQCRLFYSIDDRENKKGSCNVDEFSYPFTFN